MKEVQVLGVMLAVLVAGVSVAEEDQGGQALQDFCLVRIHPLPDRTRTHVCAWRWRRRGW